MSKQSVSARTVRAYFAEHPEKMPEGVTVPKRGRLPESMLKAYAKAHKGKKAYAVGVDERKQVVLKGPRGRKVVVSTADLRALDGSTGKRGRISAATKQAYLDSLA